MMKKAFTLIELLVVVSIIGVLIGLSVIGLQGARESSRDARRKADLETIRSAIEIYKSDCNVYPDTNELNSPLVGDDSNSSCLSTNTYIASVPEDPTYPDSSYYYLSNGTTYEICAALEQPPTSPDSCSGACGGSICNYKVVNP